MIKNFIALCSKCTIHEITNWVFENQLMLDEDTIGEIREELKDIRLKEGKCLVCNSNYVSDKCLDRILGILEKNRASSEAVHEFKKFCGMVISA